MKTKILALFAALLTAFSVSAAVTADEVMRKASATLTSPADTPAAASPS